MSAPAIPWTNEAMEAQEHVAFLPAGVLPLQTQLARESASVLICTQVVAAIINMPV